MIRIKLFIIGMGEFQLAQDCLKVELEFHPPVFNTNTL